MKSESEHDTLFARLCDGVATAEEIGQFHQLLKMLNSLCYSLLKSNIF